MKLKVFLGHSRPKDAPEEHIYIKGFDPWYMTELIGAVKKLKLKVNGLGDGDLHVGADDLRLGLKTRRRDRTWNAYYAKCRAINEFPSAEPVDVTKQAMQAVAVLKDIVKGDVQRMPANAAEYLLYEEKGVAVFTHHNQLFRTDLPGGYHAALVINTSIGSSEVHAFSAPGATRYFNAVMLTGAALRDGGPVRGNDARARCGWRLSMREMNIMFSHLVTATRTEDEMKRR